MFKKIVSNILQIKLQACIIFTASVIITMVVQLFIPSWELSVSLLWQFLVISLVGSFLQWFAYGTAVFKKMRYSKRHLIFAPLFLICLSAFAWGFQWFPVNSIFTWMIFAAEFLMIFLIISLFFTLYFRLTGRKYDEKLDLYKAGISKKTD